jgi:hypothetical protein
MKDALKIGVPMICISEKAFQKKFLQNKTGFDDYIDSLAPVTVIDLYETFDHASGLSRNGPMSPEYKEQVKRIVAIIAS